MRRASLPSLAAAALVSAMAIAACAPAPNVPATSGSSSAPSASGEPTATGPVLSIDALCDLDVVVACQDDVGPLVVTVAATAADDETVALAVDLQRAAEQAGRAGGAVLEREVTQRIEPSSEYSTPPPWTTSVFPGTAGEAEAAVSALLAVEDVPGVLSVSVPLAWPSVLVDDLDAMPAAFAAASALPLLADGGSYQLLSFDDRLRIEHTPRWVTPQAVEAVIGIAAAYPDAEVLLEAMAGGEAAPTLYVARLTTVQLAEVEAMLADASLAGASLTGGVPYVLTSIEGSGATVTGAFGA